DALWRLLKPGGKMLYCTCSIFREENEIQIAKFLQRHPECVEVDICNGDWGDAAWGERRPNGRQILTGSANMDGFYYALLSKPASS
ncbi:MAG: 16S rRNA (cytosine(967)-C(5))-methyltransferase RsmB, partial [Gammaproteobacteria bacterium]|nr:16S rRNA (cytosine(967)-C(5))-methyltransferase RsmB [Gammaproteobacteria bacterium]